MRMTGRCCGCRSTGRSQPGRAIEIELEWNARVPRTFARTGRLGDYYFIGQWFPKIGVLEDAGWNCHQFHAATEFFSDFGNYDVTLTVPCGLGRRRHGQASVRRPGAGRHGASLRAGGRPRFRVDDQPGLRGAARAVQRTRVCRRWTCGCCCSPSTRRRRTPFRRHARGAQVLRHLVRRVSVRRRSRSSIPRRSSMRRRRARAPAAWSIRRCSPPDRAGTSRGPARSRKASRCTKPAISSGTAWSPPTSSNTRGWTKGSTRTRPRACWTRRFRGASSRSAATSAA